jgi:hypothetical protein
MQLIKEHLNEPKYLEVYHNTDTVDEVMSIKKNGFKPGTRGRADLEGPVFSALIHPIQPHYLRNYGDVMIKYRIPISTLKKGYIITIPEIQKKVWGKEMKNLEMFETAMFPSGINSFQDIHHNNAKKQKFYNYFRKKGINLVDDYLSPGGSLVTTDVFINNKEKDLGNLVIALYQQGILNDFIKFGFKGFCEDQRFSGGQGYFGSYDYKNFSPYSYSTNQGKTFIKL